MNERAAPAKPPRARKPPRLFVAHETERERTLDGVELAGFRARFIAFGVDFLLSGIAFLVVALPAEQIATKMGWVHGDVRLEFNFHHWYALPFLVAYFGLMAYYGNGRTLGKRLTRIRVVSLTHERLTLWQSIERALGYGASFLEGGFGFLQFFMNPNRRTVHDRIAETIVVAEPRKARDAHPRG